MTMNATLTQHPVGQGGMMSGLLRISGGRFHWVYDCGSNQTDALNREIEVVATRGTVDCLFLSHLDSDHVNGVDRLLSKTTVREVVLPYLNNVDKLIAAAHDAATGSMTGTFLTFLSDIEGWFGARGVERITFISPRSDDDEGGEGPDMPQGGEGRGQGEIRPKWFRPGSPASQDTEGRGNRSNGVIVQQFETGVSLLMMTAHGALNWLLVPYAHRPSDKALQDFIAAIGKEFPGWQSAPDFLVNMLRDPKLREQLRECYNLIWSDHNLVSMALYAGPMRPDRWEGRHIMRCRSNRWYGSYDKVAIGWLGTGDMHLNVKSRRETFIAHYLRLLNLVNIFGLPHHGAKGNFNPLLLGEMPNAIQCVASAGKNSYGHPSAEVELAVIKSGKDFIQVGSKIHSALVWKYYCSRT